MGLGPVAGEGDIKMHCCVAAYISDYAFLGTALLPHQSKYKVNFMVSLDHSMWFHAPFRADHWMLYECESPWAGECGPVGQCLWDGGEPASLWTLLPLPTSWGSLYCGPSRHLCCLQKYGNMPGMFDFISETSTGGQATSGPLCALGQIQFEAQPVSCTPAGLELCMEWSLALNSCSFWLHLSTGSHRTLLLTVFIC